MSESRYEHKSLDSEVQCYFHCPVTPLSGKIISKWSVDIRIECESLSKYTCPTPHSHHFFWRGVTLPPTPPHPLNQPKDDIVILQFIIRNIYRLYRCICSHSWHKAPKTFEISWIRGTKLSFVYVNGVTSGKHLKIGVDCQWNQAPDQSVGSFSPTL